MTPSHLDETIRPLICPQVVHGRRGHGTVRASVGMNDPIGSHRSHLLLAGLATIVAAAAVARAAVALFIG